MTYLATFHWGWLLASLLLGLAMGWIAVVHRGQGVSKMTARWLAGLAAALIAAALAHVIPGRPGYWLDLGLIMFAVYLAGCAVGILAARPGAFAASGMIRTDALAQGGNRFYSRNGREALAWRSRKLHCYLRKLAARGPVSRANAAKLCIWCHECPLIY